MFIHPVFQSRIVSGLQGGNKGNRSLETTSKHLTNRLRLAYNHSDAAAISTQRMVAEYVAGTHFDNLGERPARTVSVHTARTATIASLCFEMV